MTIIARFWGLRHKCKFRWLVDSKIALNKVVFVTHHDYRPTKQPDNHDYLSVIRELFNELGHPVKPQWIRSHQDAKKDYKDLPPDAQHNVDAIKLATDFHKRPWSIPSRTTAHLPTSKVSISINKVRYLGNIDAHLRFHINGSYLRTYLQDKHAWDNSTWDLIDLPAFGRHLKRLSAHQKTTHLKCVHDLQPLGDMIFRRAPIKDPVLKCCPCCLQADEDQTHLLRCNHNPNHQESRNTAIKELIGEDGHPFGLLIATCVDQTLLHPDKEPAIPLQRYPPRYHTQIQTAVSDQSAIGWRHLLKGLFLATSWQKLAFQHQTTQKMETKRRNFRIQKTLTTLHIFTRSIWSGRNQILHEGKDSANAALYSAQSAEIRHHHTSPENLLVADQHYCTIALDKLLQSHPLVRRRWLHRVRTARSRFLKNGKSQTTMTQYLPHQPQVVREPTVTNPRTPADTVTNLLARSITTQSRMTDFFAGCPPDSRNKTPRNPPPI